MAKSYRPWAPAQSYLLPPSPTEWLPEEHLAYFVLEVVDELVIGEIESVLQSKDHRGERAYPPRMMVALRCTRIRRGRSRRARSRGRPMTMSRTA